MKELIEMYRNIISSTNAEVRKTVLYEGNKLDWSMDEGDYGMKKSSSRHGGQYDTGTSQAVQRVRSVGRQAREEFTKLMEELWIFIVQSTAFKAPPAEKRTLFTKTKLGSTSKTEVGWYNYPSGAARAAERFSWRADLWKGRAAGMAQEIFTEAMDVASSGKLVAAYRANKQMMFAKMDALPKRSPPARYTQGPVEKGKGGKFERTWKPL